MTGDLTKGKPLTILLKFAVPLFLGDLFQQMYNSADSIIVGRTVGINSLGAVGSAGPIFNIILFLLNGLTIGCTIILGQRFGAKNYESVRKSLIATVFCCGGAALLFSGIGAPMTRSLLEWMNTPPEQIGEATVYLRIIFIGTFATVAYNLGANVCRALGDSRTPLIFLIVASVLNIFLDLLLILVFRMGVAGVAIATVISQLTAAVGCFLRIRRQFTFLRFSRQELRPEGKEILAHLRIGFPLAFQYSIIGIGLVAVQYVLNSFGNQCVSAFVAAQKIEPFATLPLNAVGAAVTNYTAQNYGAHEVGRIRKGLLQASLINVGYAIVSGVGLLLAGKALLRLFVGDAPEEIIELGYTYLSTISLCFTALAVLLVFRSVLQGLGKGLITTLAGVAELLMRFFGSLLLGRWFGYPGLCWASPLAWIGACVPLTVGIVLELRKMRQTERQLPRRHPV